LTPGRSTDIPGSLRSLERPSLNAQNIFVVGAAVAASS
jgi:hypothetical protein